MKISVIISTYNGAHKIVLLLDALRMQTYSDVEIIIVIDGSTDNTSVVLRPYESRFKSLRIVTQENSGRSKVRNRGAKESSGDLLIFFDDDMVPTPDSIERHLSFHTSHSSVIVAGNQVEYTTADKTDIQNYKASLSKKWTDKYSEPITKLTAENLFLTAANCSIPKELFLRMNGFDERLSDAEDYDFACRALDRGIPVYFDRNNMAIHNDPISCKSYIRRLRQYAAAHRQLTELYPTRARVSVRTSGIKHICYRLFAIPLFVKLIDRNFFIPILPEKIRYRLYSLIIQALAVEYPTVPI